MAFPLMTSNGGFVVGSLTDNDDFERREYDGTNWKSRFWSETIETGISGTWTNSDTQKVSGSYSQKLLFNAALQTGLKYAYFEQDLPVQAGVQSAQCDLTYRIQMSVWPEAGVSANTFALIIVGAKFDDGTENRSVVSMALRGMLDAQWNTLDFYVKPADRFSVVDIARMTHLTVRFAIIIAANWTPGAAVGVYFDDCTVTTAYANAKTIAFPEQRGRFRSTRFTRTDDASRTMRKRSIASGLSKRNGILRFALITKAQRDALEAVYAWSDRGDIVWYPALSGYPASLEIHWMNDFDFVAATPNLDSVYNGSIEYEEA